MAYQIKFVKKICLHCKETFETSSPKRQLFCSDEHRMIHRKIERRAHNKIGRIFYDLVCEWPACQQKFISSWSDQKYHSRECLTAHYKEIRKARRQVGKANIEWNFHSGIRLKNFYLDEKTDISREEIEQATRNFLQAGGKIKKLKEQKLAFEATALYDEIEAIQCVEMEGI